MKLSNIFKRNNKPTKEESEELGAKSQNSEKQVSSHEQLTNYIKREESEKVEETVDISRKYVEMKAQEEWHNYLDKQFKQLASLKKEIDVRSSAVKNIKNLQEKELLQRKINACKRVYDAEHEILKIQTLYSTKEKYVEQSEKLEKLKIAKEEADLAYKDIEEIRKEEKMKKGVSQVQNDTTKQEDKDGKSKESDGIPWDLV